MIDDPRFTALSDLLEESSEKLHAELHGMMEEARWATFKPPLDLKVWEVADRFRTLTVGSKPGKWRTSTYQVAQGPQDAVTEKGVAMITIMAATQIMKTSVIENTALYCMIAMPAPMIVVQDNENMARVFAKDKIGQMVIGTPRAQRVIYEHLIEYIGYAGGFLRIANAGSISNIAMMSVRITACDEIDKYTDDPIHGDPMLKAERRNSTWGLRGLKIRTCSPTVEDGRINLSYNESDQRRPFVTCPYCRYEQVMRWRVWHPERAPGGGPETERYDFHKTEGREFTIRAMDVDDHGNVLDDSWAYHCINCNHPWSDFDHLRAVRETTRWKQTRPFVHCNQEQIPEITQCWDEQHEECALAVCRECSTPADPVHTVSVRHAGFWANRFYDPNATALSMMQAFQAARTPKQIMDWTNDDMAEVWVDESVQTVSEDASMLRAEIYDAPMPRRAVAIFCGVDCQTKGYLAYQIRAYGRNGESWLLAYGDLFGDPGLMPSDDGMGTTVWDDLHRLLITGFKRANGETEYINATAIDIGGGYGDQVRRFALQRPHMRVFPIKGANEQGGTILPTWPANGLSLGKAHYMLGTTEAKNHISRSVAVREPGKNFAHTPKGTDRFWYEGVLASEKKKSVRGHTVRRWRPTGVGRNEPLDTWVYAYAAMLGFESIMGYTIGQLGDVKGVPDDILPNEGTVASPIASEAPDLITHDDQDEDDDDFMPIVAGRSRSSRNRFR
jgi:phage terminase large subunit GpA-like protein